MTEEVVSLKKTDAGNLASNERMMVVGELERELLRKMPASDACSWDRTGMLVGNPMDTVRGWQSPSTPPFMPWKRLMRMVRMCY